jgi:trehalose/maltose transport system substrate-binding protein
MRCRRFLFTLKTIRSRLLARRRLAGLSLAFVLFFVGLEACRDSPTTANAVTITLLDPGWPDPEFATWRKHEEEEFTRETGIRVNDLPAPETAIDQLALWRKLLQSPSDAPDVFAIDVIWPGLMAGYSLDLTPYLADTAQDFPALVANDTVNGQLVAMPYHADAGLLFYRTDLLHDYGYKSPPATWDELEKMAVRIQKGERAKGKKDFWGYVWQGAASEALTCNALEWQASEGGGRIIEDNRTISVNNPNAIRAWERAAGWVGTISPASVTAYREWDALNVWRTGNAAFMRNWPTSYVIGEGGDSVVRGKVAATLLPGGRAGRTGTLGGASLSVFRNTRHPKEAAALVRFLCRRDVELARLMATSQPPVMPDLYDVPEVVKARPHIVELKRLFLGAITVRPSTVTGAKYPQVSESYFNAVHSVLTKKKSAPEAAADLEKELIEITGFQPQTQSSAQSAGQPAAAQQATRRKDGN